MQAYILRSALAKYRRRAWKAYEKRKEYVEAMFGLIHDGTIIVSTFYPIPHKADLTSCEWLKDSDGDEIDDDEIFDELQEAAKEMGLRLIGTIHSHPGLNTCRHLSNQDVRHVQSNPQHELLTGVLHLFTDKRRKYAHTQFTCIWEPVEVRFISNKGKIRRR